MPRYYLNLDDNKSICTDLTSVSRVSSVSSRLRAKQKKVELETRLKAMQKRKAIEMAKLQLSIEAEELELKTEIDIENAKEKVLAEFETKTNKIIEIDPDLGTSQSQEQPIVTAEAATTKATLETKIVQMEPTIVKTKAETMTVLDLIRQGQKQ